MAHDLKGQDLTKKADGMTITATTNENEVKKVFGNWFEKPLSF